MEQNYLLINKQTNVVDNVCIWDGDDEGWMPPPEYLPLVQATTPAKIWICKKDPVTKVVSYDLETVEGAGQIGFTWDGSVLTTNEPQPVPPTAK
jgi:hypothetical protein